MRVVIAALLVVTGWVAHAAFATEADRAREIMGRVLRDSRAEDETARVLIELRDASGRTRGRTTTVYAKRGRGEHSARLIRFHTPPDLARSAILTLEHADRDADQWIYLPAYHAARRIAAANRGDTWMGTDLTYEDITDPKLEHYDYTTLRTEPLEGVRCTVIAAVPTDRQLKEQSAYGRTVFWVDPAEAVALRIEYYDRGGRLLKILTNADLRRHGRYRRWAVTRVHDVTRNHWTVLTVTERILDRGLGDDLFTVSNLERGR
jgi:hypothetical protein